MNTSEILYRKMIREVEDYAIILLDPSGVIQNWNAGVEKIKGYTESEIVGRNFRIFYTQADCDAGLPEQLIREAAEKGKVIYEGWRQRKDGTLFWGSVVITALHGDDKSVIGFSKMTRDLTARRVSDEKLKRYSRELEFQNRELERFAYAAAHDMKEPLRKMRYYYVSLLDSAQSRLTEKEGLWLQRAGDAAGRMQLLIDDLLTYARTSSASGNYEAVDLRKVVDEALATFQVLIDETDARLEIGALPVLTGIGFQVRQLFENLLGNALKYRDPSRQPVIRIVCETTLYRPEDVEGETEAEYYKITLSDNGIGFENRDAPKIFDIFQRLGNKERSGGSGIGLAIVKRVMQNHRGSIFAYGEPGVGATFTLYFPKLMPSSTLQPPPLLHGA